MARVLISAGHTVMDPGQIFQDLREADLTRKIAPKIIPYLEKAGVEVKGVPLDLQLFNRIEWINNTGFTDEAGDILIEVHINDGNKRGVEAWFRGEGDNNSQKLAHVLADTISTLMNVPNQGAKSEFQHEHGQLIFLSRTKPTAVLLETLYLDNPDDIALLKDETKLEELAKSIASGILKYLGKDIEGKELSVDQKPNYDDLKPFIRPKKPALADLDLGNFDDDKDDLGFGTDFPTLPVKSPATSSHMPSMPTLGTGKSGNNSLMMDREERRKMIERNYIKVLGRAPNQSDINYFLNSGITEAELIQKMIDSQEHLDLLKAKKELEELKKSQTEMENMSTKLNVQVAEQAKLVESLNTLIHHKNQAIAELEQSVQTQYGVPSQVYRAQQQNVVAPGAVQDAKDAKLPEGTAKKIFKFIGKKMN